MLKLKQEKTVAVAKVLSFSPHSSTSSRRTNALRSCLWCHAVVAVRSGLRGSICVVLHPTKMQVGVDMLCTVPEDGTPSLQFLCEGSLVG